MEPLNSVKDRTSDRPGRLVLGPRDGHRAVEEMRAGAVGYLTDASLPLLDGRACMSQLTDRQLQVLQLMAEGCSNREIGRALFLEVNTIKVHVRNIFSALDVSSREQCVLEALRRGIVS